jgi:hypothetical protein
VRIERLAGALDRLGAETIDAIAMVTPPMTSTLLTAPLQTRRDERQSRQDHGSPGAINSLHHAPIERWEVEVNDARRGNVRDSPDIGF